MADTFQNESSPIRLASLGFYFLAAVAFPAVLFLSKGAFEAKPDTAVLEARSARVAIAAQEVQEGVGLAELKKASITVMEALASAEPQKSETVVLGSPTALGIGGDGGSDEEIPNTGAPSEEPPSDLPTPSAPDEALTQNAVEERKAKELAEEDQQERANIAEAEETIRLEATTESKAVAQKDFERKLEAAVADSGEAEGDGLPEADMSSLEEVLPPSSEAATPVSEKSTESPVPSVEEVPGASLNGKAEPVVESFKESAEDLASGDLPAANQEAGEKEVVKPTKSPISEVADAVSSEEEEKSSSVLGRLVVLGVALLWVAAAVFYYLFAGRLKKSST